MTTAANLTIYGANGDGLTYTGKSGNDLIVAGNGTQALSGGAGNDILIGGAGTQSLFGGSGDDYIYAGAGNQTLDGGSGHDTADFSHIAGRLVIDQDLHTATIFDPISGAALYTYSVTGFEAVAGTNFGTTVRAQHNTANTYLFGSGTNVYHSESGGDTITTAADAHTTFGWEKKYVATGHIDTITDFHLGADTLDMSDFLKGQGIKSPSYDQVVHIVDQVDAQGHHSALIQTLIYGNNHWVDTAVLTGINVTDAGADHHPLRLSDLGMF